MIIIDRSRLHPLGRSSNRSMPCVRSHPMKDVTERLEGEAPTRRVFQQQLFMTLAVSTVLCSVQAAPQGPEALGSKPLGREIAASASGDIPAWTQPGQQDEGWSYGQVRGEHWKFKGDKPLYSIDANNLAQHSSKLSPDRSSCSRGFPAIAWMCIRPVGPVALRTSWSRTPGRTLVSPSSMLPASLWTRLTFRASRSPCRVPVPR